jgi:NAD(P)-dependent dehydrogenase (short-subunit alcohol dehydrogenase family)
MSGPGLLDFGGRCVVVTGASSGLGRACAEQLSQHGARLLLVGRDEPRLAVTRSSLTGPGHESLVLDLDDVAGIAPAITSAARRLGPIYGLCHAAGVVDTRPLSSTTADAVARLMSVNLIAGLELARTVARRDVMERDGGSLLFLSSIYAKVGVAGETAYSATKGAVTAAARAMAVELARRRVRVNTISPGLVMTPMTDTALSALSAEQVAAIERRHPLGLGAPVDVARAAVFLLSPASRWITGVDLAVDGGYTAQ